MFPVTDQTGDAAPEALRRKIYAQKALSRADLSQLMKRGDASPDYARLLADVATDLLVKQADPPKYVGEAEADWLIGEIRAGNVAFSAEITMLTDVLRYAVSAPPALAAFCVGEIERAILLGCAGHPAGAVTPEDTQALRVAVFAAVEGSSLHVTRESAESLFRIAHATRGAANDPEFDEFFAKAVGNYLMGVAFRWTPSAAEALQKEKWLNDEAPGFDSFVAALFGKGASGRFAAATLDEVDEAWMRRENEADADELARAAEIDAGETQWLFTQLSRPGALTSAERALFAFLRREAPSLPSALHERSQDAAA